MGGRYLVPLALAATVLVTGCSEKQSDAPTAPEFGTRGVCNFTNVSSLVKTEFGANSAEASLATAMKNAGAQTDDGTYDGYQILSAIATKYETTSPPSTTNASAASVALLGCMKTGSATIPAASVFDDALGALGAFAVRGLTASDNALVASHDNAWVLEPPGTSSWQSILGDGLGASTDTRIKYAFLAFGSPVSSTGFTNDTPVSGVFDWSTLPAITFSGNGVVIGECAHSSNYMQHLSANTTGVEVLGFVQPTCPATTAMGREREPRTVGERLFRLLSPEPAFASLALVTSSTAGQRKNLSPFQVIFPGQVVLAQLFSWKKSGNTVNVPFVPTPRYQITSAKGTLFRQEKVLLWMTATNNSGTNVMVCNNWAYTNADGVAAFPNAFVNKAGGYTITTRSAGAADNSAAGVTLPTVPSSGASVSPLVNVKNAAGSSSCDNSFTPTFNSDGLVTNPPAYPGPNGQ
jgi:hypothetical protein